MFDRYISNAFKDQATVELLLNQNPSESDFCKKQYNEFIRTIFEHLEDTVLQCLLNTSRPNDPVFSFLLVEKSQDDPETINQLSSVSPFLLFISNYFYADLGNDNEIFTVYILPLMKIASTGLSVRHQTRLQRELDEIMVTSHDIDYQALATFYQENEGQILRSLLMRGGDIVIYHRSLQDLL